MSDAAFGILIGIFIAAWVVLGIDVVVLNIQMDHLTESVKALQQVPTK